MPLSPILLNLSSHFHSVRSYWISIPDFFYETWHVGELKSSFYQHFSYYDVMVQWLEGYGGVQREVRVSNPVAELLFFSYSLPHTGKFLLCKLYMQTAETHKQFSYMWPHIRNCSSRLWGNRRQQCWWNPGMKMEDRRSSLFRFDHPDNLSAKQQN